MEEMQKSFYLKKQTLKSIYNMKHASFLVKYFFLSVLLFGFGTRVTAKTTSLSGNAPSYAGEEIEFYSYSNMITAF